MSFEEVPSSFYIKPLVLKLIIQMKGPNPTPFVRNFGFERIVSGQSMLR